MGRACMCGVVVKTGPLPFQRINRSLRIDGHATSIELEAAFWSVLDEMAAREGLTTPKLLAALQEEVAELPGAAASFASTLRTICLLYQGGRQAAAFA
jgi:predicted DNA-binding ribbon-helix-helix protein